MAVYHTAGDGQDMGSLLVANLIAGLQGLVPMGFYRQGDFDCAKVSVSSVRLAAPEPFSFHLRLPISCGGDASTSAYRGGEL